MIASVSTVAYAVGKLSFGPVVDRFGGRRSFLVSMLLVSVFGALSAFAPTLSILTLLYSANRLAGAASWGAMVKQVPEWFTAKRLPLALGVLSLSYVFGGALAMSLAGLIAKYSHDNWHAVMGLPSLVLLGMVALNWLILPRQPDPSGSSAEGSSQRRFTFKEFGALLLNRQFYIICGLSFALTFMRETFNFWTGDFVKTEGGPQVSNSIAALLSTPFDVLGGLGIIWLGWLYGRLSPTARRRLLFGILMLLSALLFFLPAFFHVGLWLLATAVGLIGFLVYGPYSLLSGVLAVEVRGKENTATVCGWVDGTGYLAGILSGKYFGLLLGAGGYRLGFHCMAAMTVIAAVLCLFLYRQPAPFQEATHG
jgi:sugar phosphate permease